MYDVAIIGGGINGCGIARDAAGRGYSVLLAEMDDLARGTSSASTKLIHGGLRYLEHLEFRLVREALIEREVLWTMAPHIIWPLRFVLPHHAELRPAWLLRLGLFLYDHIGGRKRLPPTSVLDLRADPAGAPLKPFLRKAFEYSDCWVDDARLVVLNARDAADRGAVIRTRTRVSGLRRTDGHWTVALRDAATGATEQVAARLVVNAAGPWVDTVVAETLGRADVRNVRLVRGSHIVVPRLFDHDRSYILQNRDGRIVFAIPYQDAFTLIGTTDRDHAGDPADVAITDEEIDYLCAAVGAYFAVPVTRESIVWTYAGVRPLFDDGASKAQEATRDYVLVTEGGGADPVLINIIGGKITTYRKLAEAVLVRIEAALGAKGAQWTARAHLPGGDFATDGFDAEVRRLAAAHGYLDAALARRLVRAYGTLAGAVLGDARGLADLGEHFGAGLHEREVAYLARREWARTAEDVLWRRTKLGLRFDPAQARRLDDWLDAHRPRLAASAA
jgi:glycerol-3-phosphate dehydrogenase